MHTVVHHHHSHIPSPHHLPRRRGHAIVHVATSTSTSAAADTPAKAFWDYNLLFRSQRAESPHPIPLRVAEGALPPDFPRGTYYLAGPGLFSDDHGSTVHPLDGHGYLRSFHFDDSNTVHYSARYVDTPAKREESGAGEGGGRWRFTHRGPFSVLQGGKRVGNVKVMKNVANTSVLWWGGRVLCLWEGGEPYEVHPRTLETVGLFDVLGSCGNGLIGEICSGREVRRKVVGSLPWLEEATLDVAACLLRPVLSGVFNMPPKRLLAHYKMDSKRNRLLMVSCNAEDMLLPRSNFTFYEFDSNFALIQKREFVVPDHLMIHDWTFTDSHYILLGNRIKLDIAGSLLAVLGTHPMIAALAVDPSKQTTPVYLLPRSPEAESGGRDWSVPVEAPSQMWSMHVGNAFEEENDRGGLDIQLQMSACSYQWFHFHRMFGYNWQKKKLDPSFMNAVKGKEWLPHLVQVSMELDRRGACRRCSIRSLSENWTRPADFLSVNPGFANRRNRYVYASTTTGSRRFLPHFPFDSLVKVDTSNGSARLWSAEGRKFVGEPIFVPAGDREDDGYILLVEYAVSEDRCYLLVLDARKIGKNNAVVAKIEVPKHLTFPMGFHGFWADE